MVRPVLMVYLVIFLLFYMTEIKDPFLILTPGKYIANWRKLETNDLLILLATLKYLSSY